MEKSNYFTYEELTSTDTGLPNNPVAPCHLVNLAYLWIYLDSVREKLGQPVIVNSAFRSPQVNEQVGGVKCSMHMQGLAADIYTSPMYMDRLYSILSADKKLRKLSELIKYSTFYHIAL